MPALLFYMILIVFLVVHVLYINKYFNEKREALLILSSMIIFFILLSRGLIRDNLAFLDDFIYKLISPIISERLTSLMVFITHLGSAPVLIAVSVISFFILRKSKTHAHYGYMIAFNLVSTYGLNLLLKYIFKRERPDIMRLIDIEGLSFPSGHSMVSISFYGLLLYLLYMNIKTTAYRVLTTTVISILIVLVGFSRIYLGVHYATDVFAGFAVGSAWLIMLIIFTNNYFDSAYKFRKNN
ncbi:phosphatase PAP2 family protein [Haloplasma contractile]|uniref:Phosphatidylglycerophosphatase B protein n=1 Tax=Haloplasma contractile SSD-17B TaxID=1033810 RepID=F7PVD9_9MOLU|nr:phosphatase PAP2 family protein [Haloplasma contractile]ERJ12896.1 phosphatidylglycerophosphatase B protein [Haloplasma contractile SSD-17B]